MKMWGQPIKPTILLNQNNSVNLDGHTIVRGLLMGRERIVKMEDEVGGRLIPDNRNDLLNVLDEIAEYVRVRNSGRHTRERTIEYQNEQYIHRNLIVSESVFSFQWHIDFKLGPISVGGLKKMWFQKPTSIQVNRSQKGAILLP